MLKIGLTGGIGSGKTAVAQTFQELGVPIIDTDRIARDILEPKTSAYQAVLDHFGDDILRTDGTINRDALRDLVFNSPIERQFLESILHPEIKDRVITSVNSLNSDYCIIVVPLLIESGFDELVDRILVVDTSEADQIQRVVNRSKLNEQEIRKIMGAQLSRKDRLDYADDVLDNTGSLEKLKERVKALHEKYLSLCD